MSKFQVQSGSLKITIVAETAYDAAMEAVAWWGDRTSNMNRDQDRPSLAADLVVKTEKGRTSRFPTYPLVARSQGQAGRDAWASLLQRAVAGCG
ncbi:hypothetical protein Psta_2592 [Pirellula staleyi DSM 6068]|uniref:Uncharacterized protein n=1 Tax=Pirellula staleyi (strain ATCC 27377 / DSM 6068 / ICPB 4128) TaxID=530564 RepID=D2R5S9_PIRSD|nr:hypothetical protein [Pirellula staleyi]ADB17261.1 hypothetical protein Psta_2592 [Pirellula staleyi DSM 6068]